jgi:hypothetical protein
MIMEFSYGAIGSPMTGVKDAPHPFAHWESLQTEVLRKFEAEVGQVEDCAKPVVSGQRDFGSVWIPKRDICSTHSLTVRLVSVRIPRMAALPSVVLSMNCTQ